MTEGKSLAEAGKLAGFSTPHRDLAPHVAEPAVRAWVRKHMRGRLEVEAAPAAYSYLLTVLRDEKADRRLRIDVAKFLYAAAGYTPPKAQEAAPDGEKQPSEMTSDELRQFIQEGEAELANRATPIDTRQPLDDLM